MLKSAVMNLDPSILLVPTSLDGIFAKVRSPENVAEPMSIAPLIHSSVLARLQETDTPAARTFREKVLYRDWRPEDQIVPSFGPQSGATHQLTPPEPGRQHKLYNKHLGRRHDPGSLDRRFRYLAGTRCYQADYTGGNLGRLGFVVMGWHRWRRC